RNTLIFQKAAVNPFLCRASGDRLPISLQQWAMNGERLRRFFSCKTQIPLGFAEKICILKKRFRAWPNTEKACGTGRTGPLLPVCRAERKNRII
ncbi:MAG: hypothetical protein KA957_04780, partial [Syntrophaceae bacterium]|nr:hypothetical protein [Syntrophaceae bacterium]